MAKYNKKIVKRITDLIKADSYTVAEICVKVGISERCFYDWQTNNAEFAESIKEARDHFDKVLVKEAKNSLRKLVAGYDVEETKTVYTEGKDGKPKIKEKTTTKKHYQPNVAATIFMLTNKAKEEYQNRQNTDITTLGKKISIVPPKIVFTDDYEDEPDNDDEEKLLN